MGLGWLFGTAVDGIIPRGVGMGMGMSMGMCMCMRMSVTVTVTVTVTVAAGMHRRGIQGGEFN